MTDRGGRVNFLEVSREVFSAFIASCGGHRLASYYASALGAAGRYLAAFLGGEAVGYAICADEGGGQLNLAFLFVKEERRRLGIASQLLKEAESLCPSEGGGVRCCISEYADNFAFLKEWLERRGYVPSDKLLVFWCDGYGNPGYAGWELYMEKRGNGLLRWLSADGFDALVLEDAGKEVLASLLELGARGKELDLSALLSGERGKLSRRLSCLTVKDGRAVAFCAACAPDDASVVFEQIGAAPEYRNTGAIFPAVAGSIARCKEFGYARVLYSVYESNKPALSFARRVLSNITSSAKVQYNYFKQIEAARER